MHDRTKAQLGYDPDAGGLEERSRASKKERALAKARLFGYIESLPVQEGPFLYPAMIDVAWLLSHPRVRLSAEGRNHLEDLLAKRIRKAADGKKKVNRKGNRKHHITKRRKKTERAYRQRHTPRGWLIFRKKQAKMCGIGFELTLKEFEPWLLAEMKRMGVKRMTEIRVHRIDKSIGWRMGNLELRKRGPGGPYRYARRLRLRKQCRILV